MINAMNAEHVDSDRFAADAARSQGRISGEIRENTMDDTTTAKALGAELAIELARQASAILALIQSDGRDASGFSLPHDQITSAIWVAEKLLGEALDAAAER
jgi:hypothetical protein